MSRRTRILATRAFLLTVMAVMGATMRLLASAGKPRHGRTTWTR